ncbi:hypothetical protein O3M35_004438 [Rhynocoris fuscipes]|uniref:ER membrane protein complex subunit 10 n=1 Tax=Rhynocoris fuscipes TaxID=488301 RepID=A0AAW1CLE4_9HEMI
MMSYFIFIVIVALFYPNYVKCDLEYDAPISVKLYHNLEDESYSTCIVEFPLQTAHNQQIVLINSTGFPKLSEMIAQNKFYKIKAVVRTTKGRQFTFRTYTSSNLLTSKGSKMLLTITHDYKGSVMAVTLHSVADNSAVFDSSNVKAVVQIPQIDYGPVPDIPTYMELVLEREREAKERAGNMDNRSFLSKYWFYIVLLVVFAVLSGSNGEQNQGAR